MAQPQQYVVGFPADKMVKAHYQCYIHAQDLTFVPTTDNVVGGNFLPDSVHLCPQGPLWRDVTFTLPTGAVMDAAFPDMKEGHSFHFSVVNLDSTWAIHIAAAPGFTVSGSSAVVAPGTVRHFEVDKASGAANWDCYGLYATPALP